MAVVEDTAIIQAVQAAAVIMVAETVDTNSPGPATTMEQEHNLPDWIMAAEVD